MMKCMTAYEQTCLEEKTHWMRAKGNAELDHDADEVRRCRYHIEKWSDRLMAENRRNARG